MSRRTNRAQRERHGPHLSSLVALVLVNLIGLACAVSPAGTPPTPTPIAHPSEHDALVLRIETSGGLLPPFALVTELPELSVYGDGTVIVLGPQILIYPPRHFPTSSRAGSPRTVCSCCSGKPPLPVSSTAMPITPSPVCTMPRRPSLRSTLVASEHASPFTPWDSRIRAIRA